MVQKSKKLPPSAEAATQVTPKRRGRPRAYQPEVALGKALDLFRKGGFAGASLDDLSAATGMKRPGPFGAVRPTRESYLTGLQRHPAQAPPAVRDRFRDQQASP